MTNTCFKKTELPRTEEGQIYYVRNELSSTMAHFKHERHMSRENSKCEASLSLIFLFKGGGWNKKLTWLSHLLVFFLTKSKQQKR